METSAPQTAPSTESAAPVTPAAPTPAVASPEQQIATLNTDASQTPILGGGEPTPANYALDFVPERLRPSLSKYKTPDELWKGVENMQKMIGQKTIVEGIQPPAPDASDEEWNKFSLAIGRPESADKYQLPEVAIPEGYDIESEKKEFLDAALESGLNNRQAATLYKKMLEKAVGDFTKSQEQSQVSFDAALKQAFPEDAKTGFALAKKGAKALGIGDTLDQEGLSTNPAVLQLCAKLGELAGEDSFVSGKNTDTSESLLEEALRIQNSQSYKDGNKADHRKVEEIYKKVYPGAIG